MPAPDKINEDYSILEVESKINSIVDDLKVRIKRVLTQYGELHKVLPVISYDEVSKSRAKYYKAVAKYIEAADEVLSIKIRLAFVRMQLQDIMNTRIGHGNRNFEVRLKSSIASMLKELDDLKFELIDVLKSLNHRIDLMRALSYTSE